MPELGSIDGNLFINGNQIASRDHGSPPLFGSLLIESVKCYTINLSKVNAAYDNLLILVHHIGLNRLSGFATGEELYPGPGIK